MINKFYLDKEKDIIVNLKKTDADEITYILETPNHNTGNLITNLAKICGLQIQKNNKDMKIIIGKILASINSNNEEVYIFRLGGIKIANIYEDRIEIKAKIPAITKTFMSQTKNYNLPIEKTIVKTYILKKSKFRTDLHTHMNANLFPDCLIALGIVHQIRYPLYYIKKLNLKLSKDQEEKIYKQREEVEKQFINSKLQGKYKIRKIDDNTFINFADFILNNLENAEYNIEKIRNSLAIMKDGQAVFTNLEKCYIYRYIFAKGIESQKKINLKEELINKIPEIDIKKYVCQMLKDKTTNSIYKNNTLRQDKLLWIAREYQKQGIKYVEITDTDLAKNGEPAIKMLEEIHSIMPLIEKETGVQIRFLIGIRRIPLTIIKDQKTSNTYLRENINVLRAVAKSPYVVGSDFIGEEINDISIVARSKPETKMRIVQALQSNSEVVAVTGDGINDAPALSKADVGISMGISGTEVSKNASDIILTDDSFNTIVDGIKWGRGIYENFQRFIQFQLTINIVAFVIAVMSQIMNREMPFTTIQLLFINIIMDGPPALALGLEPVRDYVLKRKPIKRTAGIIARSMAVNITINAFLIISIISLQEFYNILQATPQEKSTVVFCLFAFTALFNAFNCREFGLNSIITNFFKNKLALEVILITAIVQILLTQIFRSFFNSVALGIDMWIKILLLSSMVLVLNEIVKFILRMVRKII